MIERLPSRDLVLIGAGHTNLHVVRMWRMLPIADVQLTLISPFGRATYSGMLPGTLAGLYQPDDMEIDLYRFSECCGARLIVDEVVGFDPPRRQVLFGDRPALHFDVASIGIGSVPGQRALWEGKPGVLSVKPMSTFLARFEARLAEVLGQARRVRIIVVGAGAGGTEVALGIEAALQGRGIHPEIWLIDSNSEILAGYQPGTIVRARREMARRGIVVHTGRRVMDISAGETLGVLFEDGTTAAADVVIWATAADAPPVLRNFHLPFSDDGFLAVRPTLQTTADFPVFAVGDSASIVGKCVPKAGVYAVREGPILWENLQRIFSNRQLVAYQPQPGFLSLLSTGDGRAIAEYKGISGHGRWAWRWKDYIDRKFMRMYQNYSPRNHMPGQARDAHRPADRSSRAIPTDHDAPPMRCAGCGGKIGSQVLSAALGRLSIPRDGRTTLGLATPDDAAVLDRRAAPVDVLSIDFFPAFLDDPYLVGRVAALNALSDLWAMGSKPLGAMAIATLPEGPADQQTELLYQLLAGGLRELTAAGASLWGGHSTEGPELSIGYSVAGQLGENAPFTKSKLKPGDRLILTKPLGTATLLAAHRLSLCRARWMQELVAQLLTSNAESSRLAREIGLEAVTDVTGFGLAGHLFEMLDASRVSARISLSSVPLLAGFAELSSAGLRSTLDPANRVVESRCRLNETALASRPEFHALFDPQTSGGLLLGVPALSADGLARRLKDHGIAAAQIGEVVGPSDAPALEVTA